MERHQSVEVPKLGEFSVAIPCRNEGKSGKLEGLLTLLVNEIDVGEIIVVDNNSDPDDSTAAIIKKFSGLTNVKIQLIQEGMGTADARNIAVRNATFPVIFFIDADTRFTPGTLSDAFEEFIKRSLDAGFFNFEPSSKFILDIILMTISNLIQSQMADSSSPYCMGAALVAKKQIHESAGGFPLQQVCEDTEWLRAILRNEGSIGLLSQKFIFDFSRFRDSQTGQLRYDTLVMYMKNTLHHRLTGAPHPDMFRAYDYDRMGNLYHGNMGQPQEDPLFRVDFWKGIIQKKLSRAAL